MSKTIKINVELKDRSKNLFIKSNSILDCQLDVPTLDPTSLNAFDENRNKIFKVEVKPVVHRVRERSDGSYVPDTGISGLNIVGVQSEIVTSVASIKIGSEVYARINGSIDMPIKGAMKRTTLEEAWFTDQDTANAVCMAAAEIELEKAVKMQEEVNGAVKLLNAITDLYDSSESNRPSPRRGRFQEVVPTDNEVIAEALESAAGAIRNNEE